MEVTDVREGHEDGAPIQKDWCHYKTETPRQLSLHTEDRPCEGPARRHLSASQEDFSSETKFAGLDPELLASRIWRKSTSVV